MTRFADEAYRQNPYVEQYQCDRPGTQRRGFGAFMQGFEAGATWAFEEAAKMAENIYAFDTWDDEDNAQECERNKARVGATIAQQIRMLGDAG